MKNSPSRQAARKENLEARQKLTALIEEQKQERKHLANIEAQEMNEFKESIIRQIAASNCQYTIRQLLVNTPLNVSKRYGMAQEVSDEIQAYNDLCDEFTDIIEKLRGQKAKTARIMAVNGCLHAYNLV